MPVELWDSHNTGHIPMSILMLQLQNMQALAPPLSDKAAQVTEVKATEIDDTSGNDADTEGNMGKNTKKKHRKAVNGAAPASGTIPAKNGPAVPKSASAAGHSAKKVAPETAKPKPSMSKKGAGNTAKAGNSQGASKPASNIKSKEGLPIASKNFAVQASSRKLGDDKVSTNATVAPPKLINTKPKLANNFNDWFSKARIGTPQPVEAKSSYETKNEEDVASQVTDTSEATVVPIRATIHISDTPEGIAALMRQPFIAPGKFLLSKKLLSFGVMFPIFAPAQGTLSEDEYNSLIFEGKKLSDYGFRLTKLVDGDLRWLPFLEEWGVLANYKEVMTRKFAFGHIKMDLPSDATEQICQQVDTVHIVAPAKAILSFGLWLAKIMEVDPQLSPMLQKWGVVALYKMIMLGFYTPETEAQERKLYHAQKSQKRKLYQAQTFVAVGDQIRELALNDFEQWGPLLSKWEAMCNYKQVMKRHEVEVALALSEEQKKAQDMTAAEVAIVNDEWPWTGCPPQLVLEAPLSLNRYNNPGAEFEGRGFFKLPNQNDPEQNVARGLNPGIFRILNCNNILVQICGYLFEYHSDVANLSLTCQSAFKYLSGVVQHWDLSRTDLLHSNVPNEDGEKMQPGKLLVVSPFRLRTPEVVPARTQMHSLQQMVLSMKDWSANFEVIYLHRVPFLTFEALNHVIPYMRNLKTLGVYRCPLIHFGHILRLFRMIGKAHRIETHKRPARLDFWPRYHVGPKIQGIEQSHGAYGVTWDNSELDTRLAIWCYVQKAMVIAKEIGIAEECIMSPQSALRQWMEKLCWNVGPTLQAIYDDTYADDLLQLAALFDYPLTENKKEHLKYAFPHWGKMSYCGTCKENVLGIFFEYKDLSDRVAVGFGIGPPLKCLGCKLAAYLGEEKDHFKQYDMECTRRWLLMETADGERFVENKTKTTKLFEPRHIKATLDYTEEEIEKRRLAHKGYLARTFFPEYVQHTIEPFDIVSPRVTDGKDHVSNPPRRELGVWDGDDY